MTATFWVWLWVVGFVPSAAYFARRAAEFPPYNSVADVASGLLCGAFWPIVLPAHLLCCVVDR